MCIACRRGFLTVMAGAALPLLGTSAARAQPAVQGEYLIRNAYVMTMDPQFGESASGSVHVKDGVIAAVGKHIEAPSGAIDTSGMIVMPGLIDTHWHMWHTLFRSFAGDTPPTGFFSTITRVAKSMTPGDTYQSTRLAAAEAVAAGITTVHDWCHNIRSREHAEADIQALQEVGLRAR